MRYYESKKGYFYKQYKNGKKVRISRKNFIKKQIGKKQIGKGRSISDFIINERKITLVSVSHDEALDEKEIHKLFKDFDGDANTYFLLEEDTRFTPTQLFEHYNATDNNRMTEETSRAIIGKMIQTYNFNPKLKRVEGWDIRPTYTNYNTEIRDWLYGNTQDEFTGQPERNYMRDSFNKMKEVIKLSRDHGNGNDYSDFYKLNDYLHRVFNHYDLRNWGFTLIWKRFENLIDKRIYNLIIETAKSLQEFYKNKADQYVLNKFIYNRYDTKNYIIIVGEKHYENLIKQIQIKQKQLESDNLMSIMPYYNTEMDYNNNTEMDYKNNTEMDYNNNNNTEMKTN